jgi:hypothetical protein
MIMEYSLLFQSFMVFYLLEIVVVAVFVWMLKREYQVEDQEQAARTAGPTGPSASDLIMMRQKMRELERQQG